MIRLSRALLVLPLLSLPVAAQTVPVMLDPADGQAAGCGGGVVVRLDPHGDGFLAVRTGPSSRSRQSDELYNGDTVRLCDKRGRWWGIVYGQSDDAECDVDMPHARRIPCRGPCRSGWVFDAYIDYGAG